MYTRFFIGSLLTLSLTACADMQSKNYQYQPARQIVEKQTIIDPPNTSSYSLLYGNDPGLQKAFSQYVRTGKAENIETNGFIQFAFNENDQPIVATSPFQETVISLEPGERFTNVTCGDPSRWTYTAAVSGNGPNQQANILIKPSQSGISTNMVITTDRRIYNVKLVSTSNKSDDSYVRDVRFWYPQEMVNNLNNYNTQQQQTDVVATFPDVDLNHLNFNYSVSSGWGTGPSWKPVRIFDDGKQTFIQFPSTVASRDLPVLFTLENGNEALVNYRYKAPYFVVDKIFKRAVLLTGVGRNQTRVTIYNKYYS